MDLGLGGFNTNQLVLPLATAIGAWGGFPAAPALFQQLAQNELFKWLLVFVLVWQGGTGQDTQLALITTLVMFVATKLLNMYAAPVGAMLMPAQTQEGFYY